MMRKDYKIKIVKRFLIVLLILAYVPLLVSISKYDEININPLSANTQTSAVVSNAVSISRQGGITRSNSKSSKAKYIKRNTFTLAACAFLLVDDDGSELDQAQLKNQNLFDDWNSYSVTPFCVLLCGIIVVLLFFGKLSGAFSAHRFVRYTVLPHSIHAPPYHHRKTFGRFRQTC